MQYIHHFVQNLKLGPWKQYQPTTNDLANLTYTVAQPSTLGLHVHVYFYDKCYFCKNAKSTLSTFISDFYHICIYYNYQNLIQNHVLSPDLA